MAKKKVAEAQVETTTAEVSSSEAKPEVATSLEPVNLTVNDLGMIAKIVDLASRRGAFQANELTQVGEAFDKLSGFLAYVESQNKPAEETTGPASL